MPLRGCVNEGSACTTPEAIIPFSWHWILLAEELPTRLEGVQEKVHQGSQMEKEQNFLPGSAISEQTESLSVCTILILEDMRRRQCEEEEEEDSSVVMERDLGCFQRA